MDERVWLDLERPVAKFFKSDVWVLQFAVKFYPPEPAQLQEDITRYHLCLQVSEIGGRYLFIFLMQYINAFAHLIENIYCYR